MHVPSEYISILQYNNNSTKYSSGVAEEFSATATSASYTHQVAHIPLVGTKLAASYTWHALQS